MGFTVCLQTISYSVATNNRKYTLSLSGLYVMKEFIRQILNENTKATLTINK